MTQARPRAGRYLNALFGAEPAGAYIELRITRRGGGMAQHFFDVRDVAGVEALIARSAPLADVYIGVAPRTRREGTRAAVDRLHALWVDVDGDRDKLRAFRPLPSIVVGSGSGIHGYWALADPIGPDEAERANRQIAQALDGDARATDAARILRPPGTFNHKGTEPRPVEMLRCEPEVFTLEEVVGQLPAPATPSRSVRSRAPRELDPGDTLATIAPPVYVAQLTGADVPDRGGMISCPLPDHEDCTPSCRVYADAAAGWYCYGCARGGDIVTFASQLWGVDARGGGFPILRERLLRELLGIEAVG